LAWDKNGRFPTPVFKPKNTAKALAVNHFHALSPQWAQGVGCPIQKWVQGYPAKFGVKSCSLA